MELEAIIIAAEKARIERLVDWCHRYHGWSRLHAIGVYHIIATNAEGAANPEAEPGGWLCHLTIWLIFTKPEPNQFREYRATRIDMRELHRKLA